jgi:hypothetical protein
MAFPTVKAKFEKTAPETAKGAGFGALPCDFQDMRSWLPVNYAARTANSRASGAA